MHAVNNVSFSLDRGKVLALVGESGCGKSVTCLSMLRLLPPSASMRGRILLDGEDVLSCSEAKIRRIRGKQVALIYQDPMAALNPVRAIGGQVMEPLRLHLGLSRGAARQRSAELLARVGIPQPERALRAYPHELSGGMMQRVAIAMALAAEPAVLIADEPTTALDVSVQAQILELLKGLTAELGIALLLVSHDMSVVAGLADEVAVMYGGEIVERGDALDLFERAVHPYTIGLLASIPDSVDDPEAPFVAIPGAPPVLTNAPVGCPFKPRCDLAVDQCDQRPPMTEVGPGHVSACWVNTPAARSEKEVPNAS